MTLRPMAIRARAVRLLRVVQDEAEGDHQVEQQQHAALDVRRGPRAVGRRAYAAHTSEALAALRQFILLRPSAPCGA
jgi:hypothetical protein